MTILLIGYWKSPYQYHIHTTAHVSENIFYFSGRLCIHQHCRIPNPLFMLLNTITTNSTLSWSHYIHHTETPMGLVKCFIISPAEKNCGYWYSENSIDVNKEHTLKRQSLTNTRQLPARSSLPPMLKFQKIWVF